MVHWFQYESDPELNSNVYQVASKVVSDKFPGEFGSERLIQQVVDQILKVTASKTPMEQVAGQHPGEVQVTTPTAAGSASNTQTTGQATPGTVLHRYELFIH